MDMNMDMHHHHEPASTTDTHSSTTGPNPSNDSSMSMSMSMPTVFTTSTQVTILFTGWTTTSVPSYILTLLFLFLLAVLNRFLTAWKSQLERSWNQKLNRQTSQTNTVTLSAVPRRAGSRIAKERLSPLPRYMRIDEEERHDCRSQGHESIEKTDDAKASLLSRVQNALPTQKRWQASRAWSIWQDGLFSVLECVKAAIGYFLMLTVMTFNVGVFCAVLGGIFVGELALGRYLGTESGWEDGSCHRG